MARRKGMGAGKGKGYKNIIGKDPKIHSDSAKGRKQPQRMPNLQNIKKNKPMNPSIEWISIDNEDMTRDSFKGFLNFLKKFNVDYVSYSSDDGKKTYMKLAKTNDMVFNPNHEFYNGLGEWSFYNPITSLKKKPKVSDYDIIEDMSIDPYDSDKWGNE